VVPSGPSLAVDPRNGTFYIAYAVARPGRAPADDIVLARSRDSGRTWGIPVAFTGAPGTERTVYAQPRVVAADGGTVAVTYFKLAKGRVDVVLERSNSDGDPFAPPQRITTASFDPALGLPGDKEGLWWVGDYQGLAMGPEVIYPFWNDTRTGHLEIFTAAVPIP
jgi:hypothetical protein